MVKKLRRICMNNKGLSKVLFTGTYCSLDNGTMAMVLGAIQGFQAIHPHSEFVAFSNCPTLDRERYREHVVKIVKSISGRNLLHGLGLHINILLRCILSHVVSYLNLDVEDILKKSPYLHEFSKADVVVDVSGHAFMSAYGRLSLYITLKTLFSVMVAKMLGKKFILCAQSIEQTKFSPSKILIRLVLLLADLITAREQSTYRYLRTLGLEVKVHLTSDLAFLMKPRYSSRVELVIHKVRKPLLGIVPRKVVRSWFGSTSKDFSERYLRFLAELCDLFSLEFHCSILLIPHSLGPLDLDDRHVADAIFRFVKNKRSVHVVRDELTADEQKALLGQCDLILSSRLHAAISAYSMCVPFAVLSFSNKFEVLSNAMQESNQNLIDLRKQDLDRSFLQIKDTMLKLWNNRREEGRRLKEKLSLDLDLSFQNVYIISSLLENRVSHI